MKSSESSQQREFERLLAAFSERELTEWERERLWTLLADSPERVEAWQAECRMVVLLESLSEADCAAFSEEMPPDNVVSIQSAPLIGSDRKGGRVGRWILAGTAAAAAVVAGAFFLLDSSEETGEAIADIPRVQEDSVKAVSPDLVVPVDDSQAIYEETVASLPVVASESRPPSKVETVAHEIVEVDFNNDIRPILADKCFHCHGPDEHSRKADLRLDTEEGAFADLGGYFAIKPGDAEDSEVVYRLFDEDPDSIMPPPEFHKPMSEDEKAKIVAWVNAGAEWKGHWSFEPIAVADDLSAPDDAPEGWAENPIDGFTLRALRQQGLTPNPEADRYALARRAALDVIGLPPTPQELDRFIKDDSPTAYEDYVDRLLDSVHYGEHQARFWLDAARYGDTHGMHLDNYREMWAWRDWVIDAFNRNQAFDQFSIEQLAGDLFENPTPQQLIATGFNRNHITTAEGGAIPEELAMRYMIDRTETMSTIYLGLTTGCAACHDHKYDPISQKDFYALSAFFANGVDPEMDGNRRDHYPVMVVPHEEHAEEWAALKASRDAFAEKIESARVDQNIAKWWDSRDRTKPFEPVDPDGLVLHLPLDDAAGDVVTALVNGAEQEIERKVGVPSQEHPAGDRGLRFSSKDKGLHIPMAVPFSPSSPVTISLWVRTPDISAVQTMVDAQADEDEENGLKKTGFALTNSGRGDLTLTITDAEGQVIRNLMPAEYPLTPKTWQPVVVRFGGGQANSSIVFYTGGDRRQGRTSSIQLSKSPDFGEHLADSIRIAGNMNTGGLSDVRIYNRALTVDEMALVASEFELEKLYRSDRPWSELSDEEQKQVRDLYSSQGHQPSVRVNLARMKTEPRRDFLAARNPTTQVYQERDQPAMTHIRVRGEYDNLGEQVAAATPAVLPPLDHEGTPNRLDLAQWLFRPDHPLTARVTVNRVWQSVFGRGIVRTSGDFGILGEKPTHPELLDYLADEFVESGWDIKELIRLMVTSATYRQASHRRSDLLALDPENRFLSAGPRRRLDAEVIRDQALAVSGILDRTVGGESVKPYQPAGVWRPVAFAGSNTRQFEQDELGKIHRRSVYTFWKRTAHHPALAAFNAPNREECSVVRERTNTPLQALVLMNDVQHLEAARVLAENLVTKQFPGETLDGNRLDEAFLRVVGHPADDADHNDLLALLDMARNQYRSDPEAAAKLHGIGDLPHQENLDSIEVSSWTLIINALMNRDDVINQS